MIHARRSIVIAVVAIAGCGVGGGPDGSADAGPGGTPSIEGTPVDSFETSSCSTAVVLPLALQIAAEVDCLMPGQLVDVEPGPVIVFAGSAVLPFLSTAGRNDLYAAAADAGGRTLQITSGFRTVVQQYLLRRWFELGRCGITAAAQPGQSNHETGRALDVSNHAAWVATLAAHGWDQSVPGDPVHFDHLASPDLRGVDVLAFQRLWNRNAPDDQIVADGSYGAVTADRVARAPAEGFGIGAICMPARERPELGPIAHDPPEPECAH